MRYIIGALELDRPGSTRAQVRYVYNLQGAFNVSLNWYLFSWNNLFLMQFSDAKNYRRFRESTRPNFETGGGRYVILC